MGSDQNHVGSGLPDGASLWDASGDISELWKSWMSQALLSRCVNPYDLSSTINVNDALKSPKLLDTHTSKGTLLQWMDAGDVRRWAQRPFEETFGRIFTNPLDAAYSIGIEFLNRPRFAYFIIGSGLLVFFVWVLALFSFSAKTRKCWGTLFCGLCCKDRKRFPWTTPRVALYTFLAFITLILIPAILMAGIGQNGFSVEREVSRSVCQAYRIPHTLLFGVAHKSNQYNPYNVLIPKPWEGAVYLRNLVSSWTHYFDDSDESISKQIDRRVQPGFDAALKEIQNGEASFNNFVQSLSETRRSLAALADVSHVCVVCEAAEVTDIKDVIKDVHDNLQSVESKMREHKETFDKSLKDLSSKLSSIAGPKLNSFLNDFNRIGSPLHTYYQALDPADEISQKAAFILHIFISVVLGVTALFLLIFLVGGSGVAYLVFMDRPCLLSHCLRRTLGSCWVVYGLYAAVFLIVTGILALAIGVITSPCVLGTKDLLEQGQYKKYQGIWEHLQSVTKTDTSTLERVLEEFGTFQGSGEIFVIDRVAKLQEELYQHFDNATAEVTRFKKDIDKELSKIKNREEIQVLKNLTRAVAIDIRGYVLAAQQAPSPASPATARLRELRVPRRILLSGIQAKALEAKDLWKFLPSDMGEAWLNELIGPTNSLTHIYGLEDVQDEINAILDTPQYGIPEEKRHWCLQHYDSCAPSASYGHVITGRGSTTPQLLADISRRIYSAVAQESTQDAALRVAEFQNAVLWAERKLELLKQNAFVIVDSERLQKISYAEFAGNSDTAPGRLTLLINSFTTDLISRLYGTTSQIEGSVDPYVKSLRRDVDDAFREPSALKSLLADSMITVDTVCLGVIEGAAKVFLYMLLLGGVNVAGVLILYATWHFLSDLRLSFKFPPTVSPIEFPSTREEASSFPRHVPVVVDWATTNDRRRPPPQKHNYIVKISILRKSHLSSSAARYDRTFRQQSLLDGIIKMRYC